MKKGEAKKISKSIMVNCKSAIAGKLDECEGKSEEYVCKKLEIAVRRSLKRQCSPKKVKVVVQASREVSEKDKKLIFNFVESSFAKVNVEFKNCDDIKKYKQALALKCIKFLGYDSPSKTESCVEFRFRKFLKENGDLKNKIKELGCDI